RQTLPLRPLREPAPCTDDLPMAGNVAASARRLIRNRYEVLEPLGAGGEGHVVKALDRQHGRFVALKIREVRDDRLRDGLLNEARILLEVPPHPALPLVREDFFDGDR